MSSSYLFATTDLFPFSWPFSSQFSLYTCFRREKSLGVSVKTLNDTQNADSSFLHPTPYFWQKDLCGLYASCLPPVHQCALFFCFAAMCDIRRE